MEGTPNPEPKPDLYVLQCSEPLKGPLYFLGIKKGWYYYLPVPIVKDTTELTNLVRKYNEKTGVISCLHIDSEIIINKKALPRKLNLLECLLAVYEAERVAKGYV
jgi:hypothetical protein